MRIIEVNHKTLTNLVKKHVEKYWMDDNKDAWFQFTDGCVVCIHVIEANWNNHIAVDTLDKSKRVSFHDKQGIMSYEDLKGEQQTWTDRTLIINFDKARYYYHQNFGYVTQQYIPAVEFHYYDKGESWE